jgi:hypothetical protein
MGLVNINKVNSKLSKTFTHEVNMEIEYLKKVAADPKLQDVEWWLCHDDPYYFLTHWALTLDTHDPENPIKPFPDKEYIKILVDLWMKERLLLIPKTRQMMLSWIIVGLYLWDTQFHKGRLTFFQSKKADDADALIRRAKHIWDQEPRFLKRYYEDGKFYELKANPQHKGLHVEGKLLFPSIYSEIRGIPEGGDVIRMHTASGIMSDEMAFQPAASEAWTAARPTVSSKGRFTGISTAEDNTFFEAMVFDKLEAAS